MEMQRNRNSVFQIGYHIVWCVKYRKPILSGQIADDMRELLLKISLDNNFVIEQIDIMPDHVHLFVTATPNHLIASMIKALKGVSARFLFKKHPRLKQQLWDGHLWNPSYYIATVGQISEETIKKYIQSQKGG